MSFDKKINNYNAKDITNDSDYNPVTKPYHYTQGDVECIDAIKASMTDDELRAKAKVEAQYNSMMVEKYGNGS